VFLGTRNYGRDFYNTGRETFLLPVKWVDGWPVILTGRETVPYVHARPNLPVATKPAIPHNGNIVSRDEFDATTLAPYWTMLRTPRERWYDLTSTPGSLTLHARSEALTGRGQPSLIARRQQNGSASASTAMTYLPAKAGDRAGLVAFHNEDHYYFVGVVHDGGRPVIQVRRRSGRGAPGDSVLASAPVELTATAPVYLEIRTRDGRIDFLYGMRPNAWTVLLADADGTVLSTRKAGGFVGTMLGMYAYSEAK
jgi:alpha-N-arabinofuranosidase